MAICHQTIYDELYDSYVEGLAMHCEACDGTDTALQRHRLTVLPVDKTIYWTLGSCNEQSSHGTDWFDLKCKVPTQQW